MTDWQMLVEKWDGRTTFPKFTDDADQPPPGPKRFTTTLKYLRAWRGQFTFEDHEAPWSVVARNIDINIGNLPKYHGTATFTGGTVAIQHYVPFAAKMRASFVIDDGRIHLDRIEFDTDGAKTVATGVVDVRALAGADLPVQVARAVCADAPAVLQGREMGAGRRGRFHRHVSSVQERARSRRDVRERVARRQRVPVSEAVRLAALDADRARRDQRRRAGCSAATAASPTRFGRSAPAFPPTARFEANFAGVDLASFTDFEQLKGLRFAGTASGERVLLEWPLGRFADHRGSGHLVVTPPAGVQAMTASLAAPSGARSSADRALHEWGPFAPAPLPRHLPIAGELTYRFDPEQVDFEAEPVRDRAHRRHVPGVDRVGRRRAHGVSRDERRLAGKRSGAGRHHDRLRRADESGHVRRPRRVRRDDDRAVPASAGRRRVQRRGSARVRHAGGATATRTSSSRTATSGCATASSGWTTRRCGSTACSRSVSRATMAARR